MNYQFYKLQRLYSDGTIDNTATGWSFVFDDTPPVSEGYFDIPRQTFKTVQAEKGTVYIDYGVDPANQTLKLTVEIMPEFLMKILLAQYMAAQDTQYFFTHHRGGPPIKVKWKDMGVTYIRTLQPSDAQDVYQYYVDRGYATAVAPAVAPLSSPDDIADLYKVVIEFYNVPDPLT